MDDENKTAEQLAAEINSPQIEPDTATETAVESPVAPTTSDDLILGKFKSQDDLVHAYTELERSFTASRQAIAPTQPTVETPTASTFDAETEAGISSIVEDRIARRLEKERAQDFAWKHRDDLSDPLLRGAVLIEIQDANSRGEYMDQETALARAKQALETRLAPKVEQASQESFEEGKSLARKKEQAGAVGATSGKAIEVNPDDLNAEEYASYYGLK